MVNAYYPDVHERIRPEILSRYLEAVDPEAAYWIPEIEHELEHISIAMLRQLRLRAEEAGMCFGRERHDHGPLGFFPKIPWLYQLLRKAGHPASEALELTKMPHVELEPGKKIIRGPVDVELTIGRRQKGTVVDSRHKQAWRRRGVSTYELALMEAEGHWVRAACEAPGRPRQFAILRIVPRGPYADSARLNLTARNMIRTCTQ